MTSLIEIITKYGLEKLGRYYGNYRGVVVDNTDTLHLQRVFITVPQLFGRNSQSILAYPKGSFSGKGYGAHLVPSKGDPVWVEFDQGNVRYPIWSYGHHNEIVKPPEEFNSNSIYGFKTPKGNTVLIDDEKGLINLTNSEGYKIQIIEDKIYLGNDLQESQPLILGNELVGKLQELISAIKTITVPTAWGLSGTPTNQASLTEIAESLEQTLSKVTNSN